MTDLQLGLLLIGAAAVAGVLVYNRVQVRSARRGAQRAFESRHADVLLQEESGKQAPSLDHPPGRRPEIKGDAMPDSRVDYVVNLDVPKGVAGAVLLETWGSLENRFAKRVMLAGSTGEGWRRILPGESGKFIVLQAALQILSRDGVVADAELLEFRSQVETLGAGLGATLAAPEMRAALDAARELDQVCADADIQIALHVIGIPPQTPLEAQLFQVSARQDGLTLSLDVGRTLEPDRAYEAMARAGTQLAASQSGQLVDDNGQALDARALAAIAAQLESIRAALAHRGIEAGSPLALRLFS